MNHAVTPEQRRNTNTAGGEPVKFAASPS
jgi:hypothetical protein